MSLLLRAGSDEDLTSAEHRGEDNVKLEAEKGEMSQELKMQPPETQRQGMDSHHEPWQGGKHYWHLDFSPVILTSYFWPPEM